MSQSQPPVFALPAHVGQEIGNYLATRPWGEVNPLIMALQSLQPVQMPEPDKEEGPSEEATKSADA